MGAAVQGSAGAGLLLGTWHVRGFETGLPWKLPGATLMLRKGGIPQSDHDFCLTEGRNHLKLVRLLKTFFQHIPEA